MIKAVVVGLLFLSVSVAAAEGCPKEPVAENGGEHWCYDAGNKGHVHLWKPDGYEAKKAVTVVYVHGYNLGVEGCANAHYLDCAWDAHALSKQFAASGMKALFVAIEGPVNDWQKAKWKSLDALLSSIRRRGGMKPPSKVVAIAHSGGIFTLVNFLKDSRLAHVVALDALYKDSPKRLTRWYRSDKSHRLTLVGADSVHARTKALGRTLGCSASSDVTGTYARNRCAASVDPNAGHMAIVQDGDVIPRALERMRSKK